MMLITEFQVTLITIIVILSPSLIIYKFYNKKKCFILLSPAAASFDQFKNFEIRGNKFKKLCKKYARKFI